MPIPNPYRVFFKTDLLTMSTGAGNNVIELETKCNQIRIYNELMITTGGNFAALDVSNIILQFSPRVEGVLVKPRAFSSLANPVGNLEPLRFNDEFVLEAPDQGGIIEQKIKIQIPQNAVTYASSLVIVRRFITPI